MIDGNTHALRQYEDRMEQAELAYEAYLMNCSDEAGELEYELRKLCNFYESVVEHKELFDKYGDDFMEQLREDIYSLYTEIEEIFNNTGDYDWDWRDDLKEFLSASTLAVISECEY